MMTKKLHPLFITSTLYVVLSLVLGVILTDGLIVFLGWNMILATLPLLLSMVYLNQTLRHPKKTHRIVILILYVLFFPNALYILTDVIHFEQSTFFVSYPNIYRYDLVEWMRFFHIVSGALIALKIGLTSLVYIKKSFHDISDRKYYLYLNMLFFLSSIGIFIGRFLRFNSWEIFRITHILLGLFENFGFMVGFVAIMFVLHWISYFLFLHLDKTVYNIDIET